MNRKNQLFPFIFLVFLFTNCAPTFDLEKEHAQIEEAIFSGLNLEKKIDIFYPNQNKRDSIKNILKGHEQALHELKQSNQKPKIDINSTSSTIEFQDRLFKIINVTEQFSILKKDLLNTPSPVLKDYLESNLYEYSEDANKFDAKGEVNVLAIHYKGSWEYFDFNTSLIYDAYGLKDAKKLVQLYYDEVFEPAKEKWDEEHIQDFKKIYFRNKDLPQYQNLDFDAYCDCLIRHEEKLDYDKILETNYYESDTRLNVIYQCRILTSRE